MQIQRLIMKLSQEQHARIDVEDRLEETLVDFPTCFDGIFDVICSLAMCSNECGPNNRTPKKRVDLLVIYLPKCLMEVALIPPGLSMD